MSFTIFIGSSSKQKDLMDDIAGYIDGSKYFKARKWTDVDVFNPGNYTLDSLIKLTKEVDAAVFLFSPDDDIKYLGEDREQPRDNVLIEYGLFMGQLGKENVVFCRVTPRVQPESVQSNQAPNDKLKTARDVDGVTYIDLLNGWDNAAQLKMKNWLRIMQNNKLRMSGDLERISYPAIEFSITVPTNDKFKGEINYDLTLTDINQEGKSFFKIEAEENFLGQSLSKLMSVLKDYVDPPPECWEDLVQDQSSVYNAIKSGLMGTQANIAIKINERHTQYSDHVFVPLIVESRTQREYDGYKDVIITVIYLDISNLPRHVFGEKIWKIVTENLDRNQLANELEQIANIIQTLEPQMTHLHDAGELILKGEGARGIELLRNVSLDLILRHASISPGTNQFLNKVVQLPTYASYDNIFTSLISGLDLEQLSIELKKIATIIQTSAQRVGSLTDAVKLLRKGRGPQVIELLSDVGLYSIKMLALNEPTVRRFLLRLLRH